MVQLAAAAAVAAAAAAPFTCPGDIQKGVCQHDAPSLETLNHTDEAACCEACLALEACISWNVNTAQGKCHLRGAWAPNPGHYCSSAKVRDEPTYPPAPKNALNVLYIACDDFRPQIMALGVTDPARVATPNLDKLVRESAVFTKAYVQQAACSPSRNSFTIGRRPQNSKVWNFLNNFRDTNASWLSMPEWFKKKGFLVNGNGKFYHHGHPKLSDAPYSWSSVADGGWEFEDPNHQISYCDKRIPGLPHPFSCVIPEEDCVDHLLMNLTKQRLRQLKKQSRPWFLAVGHIKPHPFWALPQWAFDQFPIDTVPLPNTNMTFPGNMFDNFEPAYYACGSFNTRSEVTRAGAFVAPYTPLPADIMRKIRQGYFAGVALLDKVIGGTLQTLDDLGLAQKTIVIMHSDHGWELGERGSYCKMGVDELRTRIPLMIRDPSRPQSHGTIHRQPTEAVNIFATIAELATGEPLDYEQDGVSLANVLDDPSADIRPPKGFKTQLAFSVFPRCMKSHGVVQSPYGYQFTHNSCNLVDNFRFTHMGLAVRSENFRYVEWRLWDGAALKPRFDVPAVMVEVYNHTGDVGASFDDNFEHHNYVGAPELADVEAEHAAYVEQMWKK